MCFTFKKSNKHTKKPVNGFLQDGASASIRSLKTSVEIKLCQNPWNGLYFPLAFLLLEVLAYVKKLELNRLSSTVTNSQDKNKYCTDIMQGDKIWFSLFNKDYKNQRDRRNHSVHVLAVQ